MVDRGCPPGGRSRTLERDRGPKPQVSRRRAHPDLEPRVSWRLLRNYGSFAYDIAENRGEHLGDGVWQGEIEHLRQREYARTLEDVLWRRSKLGLSVSDATADRIQAILSASG